MNINRLTVSLEKASPSTFLSLRGNHVKKYAYPSPSSNSYSKSPSSFPRPLRNFESCVIIHSCWRCHVSSTRSLPTGNVHTCIYAQYMHTYIPISVSYVRVVQVTGIGKCTTLRTCPTCLTIYAYIGFAILSKTAHFMLILLSSELQRVPASAIDEACEVSSFYWKWVGKTKIEFRDPTGNHAGRNSLGYSFRRYVFEKIFQKMLLDVTNTPVGTTSRPYGHSSFLSSPFQVDGRGPKMITLKTRMENCSFGVTYIELSIAPKIQNCTKHHLLRRALSYLPPCRNNPRSP